MPPWYCPQCDREFTNSHRFQGHLKGQRNWRCQDYYDNNPSIWPTGVYDPISRHANPPPLPPEGHRIPRVGAGDVVNDKQKHNEDANESKMEVEELPDDAGPDFSWLLDHTDEQDEPKEDCNDTIMGQFKECVDRANQDFVEMPIDMKASVELIGILTQEGAPLGAYDKIIEWHFQFQHQKEKITRRMLVNKLRKRHNMEQTKPKMVPTHLPHAGITIGIPCHNAEAMVRDLLSDPRIEDVDYLFENDDPLQGPPPESEWAETRDINTGRCYRQTHRDLIEPNPHTKSGAGERRFFCP